MLKHLFGLEIEYPSGSLCLPVDGVDVDETGAIIPKLTLLIKINPEAYRILSTLKISELKHTVSVNGAPVELKLVSLTIHNFPLYIERMVDEGFIGKAIYTEKK